MPPSKSSEVAFIGTERFFVQRRMGAGGMGVVYQALDRERNQVVALKTLRDLDAGALVRFKREFRSLADISHPNLVSLYELISDDERLFFTMELVSGVSFLRWVRGGDAAADATAELSATGEELPTDATSPGKRRAASSDPVRVRSDGGGGTLDAARLRRALPQLAEGVAAIHDRGLLHRDLKPSNVLVTHDGRVKILDFGLVTEIDRERQTVVVDGLAGTAAYMSPEQGARQPLGPASDWYAVGVMLYEALTGRLPFVGGSTDVLMDKQRFEPPPPRELVAGVPPDLDTLCAELLRREPEARPNAREVLRRLGVDTGALHVSSGPSTRSASAFIGRGRQMSALADAFSATRRGRLGVAFVHGSSGMGKSALVRRFLDGIEARDEALVVTGRCYERESVPYKAVDSVIDALSQHLARLPRLEAEGIMPRDVAALARLFPALRQVEAVTASPRRSLEAPDPQELRRRAFAALRELLARLADRRPLIIAIDDLQWGDIDSAALLAAVVRPPDAPALLFIASHRSEDHDSTFLRHLRAELALHGDAVREVEVGPLEPFEAVSLAQALVDDESADGFAKAERIAAEAHGNPFFIDELARHVRDGESDQPARISLDEVLRARLRRLPPPAAHLLAIIATAGRPITVAVAQRAAEVSDPAAIALLKAGNLVRTRGAVEASVVECYHDRIREAQLALLDPERTRRAHLRLAIALESSPRPDAEALAVHFAAAGEHARASDFAAEAAARAAQALAFDRAARLYRLAIELAQARIAQHTDLERSVERGSLRPLYARLGDALANAGRGQEAAEAYLLATTRAPAGEVLELRRRAATQLLLSGHFSEGLAALREVTRAVDMRMPETPAEALTALLWRRARIRLRGLGFKQRDASTILPEQLTRIDVADAATTGIGMVDSINAASFQAHHLLLALDAGEPRRAARALSAEAIFQSLPGTPNQKRVERTLTALAAIVDELGSAEMRATYEGTLGLVAFQMGQWRRCLEYCQRAITLFRDHCTGCHWEISTTQIFSIYAESLLGRLRSFMVRLPSLLKEAAERGDLYTQTILLTAVGHTAALVDDQPERSRQEIAEALRRWNVPDKFHLQHFNGTVSETSIDLYCGDATAAWQRIDGTWSAFRRSLMLRVQPLRVSAHFAHGRAALAAARTGRRELVRVAAADARALQREPTPYAVALGTILEGGAHLLRGDRARAESVLDLAARLCEAPDVEMHMHAHAVRWELGRLIGGSDGQALVDTAERALVAEGVRRPDAMVSTFTGGITR